MCRGELISPHIRFTSIAFYLPLFRARSLPIPHSHTRFHIIPAGVFKPIILSPIHITRRNRRNSYQNSISIPHSSLFTQTYLLSLPFPSQLKPLTLNLNFISSPFYPKNTKKAKKTQQYTSPTSLQVHRLLQSYFIEIPG